VFSNWFGTCRLAYFTIRNVEGDVVPLFLAQHATYGHGRVAIMMIAIRPISTS